MTSQLSSVEQWKLYERQSGLAQERALERLKCLQQIDSLMNAGMNKSAAVKAVASTGSVSAASIWGWLKKISGVSRSDRLAYLIPGFRGGGRRAHFDDAMFCTIATDYLRPEAPSWAECVRRLKALSELRGVDVPHARTLWRRLHREYDGPTIAMMRSAGRPGAVISFLPANDT